MLRRTCRANPTTLEFKEIRKEWKARKKAEEAERKAQEEAERQRQAQEAAAAAQNGHGPEPTSAGQAPQPYASGGLPPIRYQPAGSQYPAPPSASVAQQPLPEYSPTSSMHPGYYPPASPYAPPGQQQMYSQRQ